MRTEVDTGIPTADALKIAGMSTMNWRVSVDKGMYRSAPPVVDGRRLWDVDSLVALTWYDSLVASGAKRTLAGKLAEGLTAAIAMNPQATQFLVYGKQIQDEERVEIIFQTDFSDDPRANLILVAPLALWRVNVRRAIADFYTRKGAQRARKH